MKIQYTFDYLKCQSCTAKIHCESCGEEVMELFREKENVKNLLIDMKSKTLSAEIREEDEDDLLDDLEAAGIFV